MLTLWFIIVALMLAAYVILDGFDLGAGILHFCVARTDSERRAVLHSIGPVWDGNEVWLLAAGGTLYFAFPLLYASSFSGFYLPLIMVVWMLMGRAMGIEFRHHIKQEVWTQLFDFLFMISSALLAIFYGAALGNVIRGVPLDQNGLFFEPLWTNFRVGANNGILDWYTVLAGLVAFFALALHGANWLAMKTDGDVRRRARRTAGFAWYAVVLLTILSLVATIWVRPEVLDNYRVHPVGYLIPVIVFVSLLLMRWFHARERACSAFLSGAVYLAFMLVGAAFALYPVLLPSSTNPANSLTIYNVGSSAYGMKVGLVWWILGILIAIGYFVFLFRFFRGRVHVEEGQEGY
jgi:cytochrome d ubiquinol oxidase subunit II